MPIIINKLKRASWISAVDWTPPIVIGQIGGVANIDLAESDKRDLLSMPTLPPSFIHTRAKPMISSTRSNCEDVS